LDDYGQSKYDEYNNRPGPEAPPPLLAGARGRSHERSDAATAKHRRQTIRINLASFWCSTLPSSSINSIISRPTLRTDKAGALPAGRRRRRRAAPGLWETD